jgi:hypothetical protein
LLYYTQKERDKEIKKMATVYFCDYGFEARGKRTGTVEEIKAIVDSWKSEGFTVFEFKPNVWIIEM